VCWPISLKKSSSVYLVLTPLNEVNRE
jgi:hypothetical protein